MTKVEHLAVSRNYLQKVVKFRRGLIRRQNKGKPDTPEMEEALRFIGYHAVTIKTFEKMMDLLEGEKNVTRLKLIVPTNKPEWWVEHEHLVFEGNLILGKVTKQMQIDF